jgi:hypothetical protein
MYLGFMRQGTTFMFLFFFSIFLADFLRISLLFSILPVIWCYSFFDTLNKSGMSPEKLATLEDKSFLAPLFRDGLKLEGKKHAWLGIALIIIGIFLIFNNFIIPELERMNVITSYVIREYFKTIFVSGAIVALGIRILTGKKEANQGREEIK